MIDQDGQSDYVIKRFGFWNSYQSKDAQLRAERAAKKISQIYDVINATSGFAILPNRVFAAPYNIAYPNGYVVYEEQQRGIFGSHWSFFDPKTARKIDQEIKRGYERFDNVTIPELERRGLIKRDFWGLIKDHLTLYVSWDFITNQLVARDVVDAVTD